MKRAPELAVLADEEDSRPASADDVVGFSRRGSRNEEDVSDGEKWFAEEDDDDDLLAPWQSAARSTSTANTSARKTPAAAAPLLPLENSLIFYC